MFNFLIRGCGPGGGCSYWNTALSAEKFAKVFKEPFNKWTINIFEVNLVELISNSFVELPISFSHFTRFFIL